MAKLMQNHIIRNNDKIESGDVREEGSRLGLKVSRRTVQRIVGGEFGDLSPVSYVYRGELESREKDRSAVRSEVEITLGDIELDEIATILRRIVQARYLDMGDLRVESGPGEISLRTNIFEPEDEYE